MPEFRAAAALVMVVGASGVAFDAHGAAVTKTSCTVVSVNYDEGRVAILCSGDANFYYASTGQIGTNCPVSSFDSVKVFAGIFQSALVSGRPVNIVYENACGPFAMYQVQAK